MDIADSDILALLLGLACLEVLACRDGVPQIEVDRASHLVEAY